MGNKIVIQEFLLNTEFFILEFVYAKRGNIPEKNTR
jgi:hypothetical protein